MAAESGGGYVWVGLSQGGPRQGGESSTFSLLLMLGSGALRAHEGDVK
jgi:hypothetical protein